MGKDDQILTDQPIQSKISMNLDQNDILAVVVDEFSESLEKQIDNLSKTIKEDKERLKKPLPKHIENLKKRAKKHDIYKRFLAASKVIGGTIPDFTYRTTTGKYRKDYNEDYIQFDGDRCENFNNPVRHITGCTRGNSYRFSISSAIDCSLSYSHKGVFLEIDPITVNLTEKEFKEEVLYYDTIIERLVSNLNQLARLQQEYIRVTHGGSRMKSKLIKASLANSTQGKQLLGLMTKATGIKLLQ